MTPWSSSYLLGNDSTHGWGTRYFFTFYSECGDRGVATAVEVAVLVIVFVTSVVANLGIAAAVLRYPEMRTVINCFLLNLAVADCLFAAGIPAVVLARVSPRWMLGDLSCRLLPYSQFVCGFVLLWTLTLISMDRYHCIAVPPYRSRLTTRRAATLTAAVWVIAAVLLLPVAFLFHNDVSLQICTLVFPRVDYLHLSLWFTVPVIFFACILPISLLIFFYKQIFDKLLKRQKRWATNGSLTPAESKVDVSRKLSFHHIVSPIPRSSSLTHHEEKRLKKHLHVARVLLLNVLVVVVMWIPITAIMFLIYVDGQRPNEDTKFFLRSHHFVWAVMVAYLNTAVNPLLYGILSENFRKCFSRMWSMSRRRRQTIRALDQDNSKVQRTPSCVKSLDVSQTSDKKPQPWFNLSCSDSSSDRSRPAPGVCAPSADPPPPPATGEALII